MLFFKKSLADREAKKIRHSKVRQTIKELKKKKRNPLFPRSGEKEFFWQVISLGTAIFFFTALLPNFSTNVGEFWISAEAAQKIENEDFAMADEGFFMQPAMQTERGNREHITKVIEIFVQPGDTVSSIAHKYGISIETVVQNNSITSPNRLKVGKKIVILPVDGFLHEVDDNETLSALAEKYKVEKEKIISQNNLEKNSSLKVGQQVIIPGFIKETAKRIASGAVSEIAARKFAPGTDFGGKLFFPCRGRYTQFYHYGHYAVDIAESGGSPIWAAESGEVIKAQGGWNGGYGNMVVIDHGNGMKTLYAHMREIYVDVGSRVTRGQSIGFMGATGRVYGRTGIHLHFEVIVRNVKKNPLAYF